METADLIRIDPAWLSKWNRATPRYTSYPTAPQFYPVEETLYQEKLLQFDASDKPLSLYIHIPFCRSMCLFCGCSVILNRRPERQRSYLDQLIQEIELLPFQKKRKVTQLHFGGGTPTSLSEEEFEELLAFLQEAQLDRVGCFTYSPVEGATANRLPDPVPEEIKQDHRARFMQLQEGISRQRLATKVGRRMTVMIDEMGEDQVIARSSADAPEIDGLVYLEKNNHGQPGDFIEVEITGSDAHDLFATMIKR